MEITKKDPKGYISNGKVKASLFTVISVSILVCVMMIILSIWGYVGKDVASKVVGTLATIIAGGILFSWVNNIFGPTQVPTDEQTEQNTD